MKRAAEQTRGFALFPTTLGSFGSPRSLRVLWFGVRDSPNGALAALRDRLASSLQGAGVSFEEGAFRPHLTLGRVKRNETPARSELMHRAIQALGRSSGPLSALAPLTCEEVALIRSDLQPTGPIYTPLHHAPFG